MSGGTNLRAWRARAGEAYEPPPTPEAMARAAGLAAEARTAGLQVDEVDTDAIGGMSLRFFDPDCTRGRYAWVACLNSGADTCCLAGSRGQPATSIPLNPPPWARIKEYLGR